jgi:hypothetical protein
MDLLGVSQAARRRADPAPLNRCGVESASIESLTPPKWQHCERNAAVCQTYFNKLQQTTRLLPVYYGNK